MTNPLISVIVPIYNSKKYLEKCLSSIQNQTYCNLQIICVDDGSSDGSSDIAKDFAEKDKRFIYIWEENHGESYARNTGLPLSEGGYICFVDCDDYVDSRMYETMLQTALKYNADITAFGWYKEFENESIVMRNRHSVAGPVISKKAFMHHVYLRDEYQAFAYMWNKLFKRDVIFDSKSSIPKISFNEDIKLGGDMLFMAESMLASEHFAYIDEYFYHYVQRQISTSHKASIPLKIDRIQTYEKIIKLYSDSEIDEEIIKLVKRFLVYHCSNLAEVAYKEGNKEALLYAQGNIRKYYNEYIETNKAHIDRIKRIEEIMKL